MAWLPIGCSGTSPADTAQSLADLQADRDAGLLNPGLPGSPPNSQPGLTDLSTLPSSGIARYTGAIALEAETGDLAIIGTLALTANFEDPASISGQADGFTGSDDRSFDGALFLSNGVIDPSIGSDTGTGFPIRADVGGTLADHVHSYAIDAQISGRFIGAAYNGVAGFAEGTITSNLGRGSVVGVFNVER